MSREYTVFIFDNEFLNKRSGLDMKEVRKETLDFCSTSVRGATSRSFGWNRTARVVEFESESNLFKYLLAWAWREDLDIWLTAR